MKLKYDDANCNRFVRDMEKAGFEVEHYRGRNYYTGPAVRVEGQKEMLAVIRATKITLQRDDMGLGSIWYPVDRGTLIEEAAK